MVRNELSEQTVMVGGKQTIAGRAWQKMVTHKKKIVIVAFLLLLVGAGAWFVFDRTIGKEDSKEVKILSESQADQLYLKKLQTEIPGADSSVKDVAEYYDKLQIANANVGDYDGAVKAFEQHEKLAGNTLAYSDYLRVANYYYRIKDNTAALAALDKAEALLPTVNNPETDYSREEVLASINQFREALK